ncbi:hypothetical protein K466DRAFT_281808 [Polyporus arcularius HHB13444]|uniref:Uncharacterized protein n=1 Tax=Polyporus arcularius HHB13444 TaxID=1314778 RepID=A0A5C3NZR0_9APHY|nr:hypothetical protein K466DRAFT_281808 [Polyporus arcularius HHB13444]
MTGRISSGNFTRPEESLPLRTPRHPLTRTRRLSGSHTGCDVRMYALTIDMTSVASSVSSSAQTHCVSHARLIATMTHHHRLTSRRTLERLNGGAGCSERLYLRVMPVSIQVPRVDDALGRGRRQRAYPGCGKPRCRVGLRVVLQAIAPRPRKCFSSFLIHSSPASLVLVYSSRIASRSTGRCTPSYGK